ncbi:MAG TPA: sugar phosphate isomerase/epimerase [Candidatus Alistipes intestinigallinarum]|uniref:Sugar phosphate isomerase/epimerase n=1 Tax=Candidatus Alistipes intestinigallinarum TaxID=2838440 RepID=A0A9D1Z468_9BACT|nr:sugar phosphate isomerase/epimerase [Candidatus Alistipes intestinigallinarum]
MRSIAKRTGMLLLAAMLLGGCRSERQRVYDAYCSWPMGLSVSLTMPEEQLREVREAGFDYVEVTLNSLRTKSREECSAALERFRADAERVGLTIWSVHLPFGRAWDISSPNDSVRTAVVDRIAWFIEAVQPLRPRKMILHPSAEPIADSLRGLHIEHSIHSINTLAAVAARYEAQLLVEDLPRTCLCNTSGEMLSIFERLDPAVGVCFDTNHLLRETPEAFARALGGRIASLHVSDYDAVDEKHWLMGRGTIDWPSLVTALADIGYEGVFLFEVGGYDSFREVAGSWDELKRQLASENNDN